MLKVALISPISFLIGDFKIAHLCFTSPFNTSTHQAVVKSENTDVTTVMYVIATHNRIGVVLYPNAGQCISAYLVVLVRPLSIIRYIQTHILAVAYIAMANDGVCTDSAYTNCSAN